LNTHTHKRAVQQEIAPTSIDAATPVVPTDKQRIAAFFKLDKTRRITSMGVIIALAVVTKMFPIPLGSARLTFFLVPVYLAGGLFGPLFGFCVGAGADLLGAIFGGLGAINPVVTVANGLAGALVGLAFYWKALPPLVRFLLGGIAALLICSLGLNTWGLAVYTYKVSYWNCLVYLGFPFSRIVIQPINFTITMAVCLPAYWAATKYLLHQTSDVAAASSMGESIFDDSPSPSDNSDVSS
jgi:ECF transporter S component (folate family)